LLAALPANACASIDGVSATATLRLTALDLKAGPARARRRGLVAPPSLRSADGAYLLGGTQHQIPGSRDQCYRQYTYQYRRYLVHLSLLGFSYFTNCLQ
jgi:hypothetical protein